METYTVLDIIERRKSGRRSSDAAGLLATYWPVLVASAVAILLLGIVIGHYTA